MPRLPSRLAGVRRLGHRGTVALLLTSQAVVLLAATRAVARAGDPAQTPAAAAVAAAPARAQHLPLPPAAAQRAAPRPRPVALAAAPHRATTRARAAGQRGADPWARFGFDISWPQCTPDGPALPPRLGGLAIVGITGGRPGTANPCLAEQWTWARSRPQHGGYINVAYPNASELAAMAPACPGHHPGGAQTNAACQETAFGAATVRSALQVAARAGAALHGIWLDVETGNHWSNDPAANVRVIDGAAQALQAAHLQPGVYSSDLDWTAITGDGTLPWPEWRAIADGRQIVPACGTGFGGEQPALVQAVFLAGGRAVDGDLVCRQDPALASLLSTG